MTEQIGIWWVRRIKNIPNIITCTRILAAPLMILVEPMSNIFWGLYIYCFISDILDGYIARKKNIVSDIGAILDSVADTVFFCAVFISIVPMLVISRWLLWGIGIVALIRVASYIVGFIKYKSFTSLHTWLNKMTGFLLIISPLLLVVIDLKVLEIIIGGIALISAIEELLIIIWSKELNRDIKCIFVGETEMIIRKYEALDCKELTELFYNTVHTVNAKDYTKEQLCVWATGSVDLENWNSSLLEHFTFVAVKEDVIVGFGDIDKTGYLDRLYVHKDYQYKGIATAICDELENAVDTPKIYTHASITAKPFFEKRGYKVVSEQQVERQGLFLTNYIMEK